MSWNESSIKTVTERAARNARSLRRTPTEAERRLWWHLRYRLPKDGSHFRRQVPLGSYVADFCCLADRLIIEVDGDQHGFDGNRDYDARREVFLRANGYRVLRFSNADVMQRIDSALDTILAVMNERHSLSSCGKGPRVEVVQTAPRQLHPAPPPPPASSPQGGGEPVEP